MKMNKVFSMGLLLAVAMLLFGCEKEEMTSNNRMRLRVDVGHPGFRVKTESVVGEGLKRPAEDADILLYITEEDYLLDQNAVAYGTTDDKGRAFLESDYWGMFYIRVRKDGLNNQRFINKNALHDHTNYTYLLEEIDNTSNCCLGSVRITLSTTPTRLQLTVYHSGQLVEDAKVQLYLSQEAYETNKHAQFDYPELERSYLVLAEGATEPEYGPNKDLINTFLQTTNESGVVLFENLEPRHYWFRIEKDNLSNEGGMVKLEAALPDNADLTSAFTVGIE